jgi:hypothetical protein
MSPTEIVYFAVILFFALVALAMWKRRHDQLQTRINRGLHGYVTGKHAVSTPIVDDAASLDESGEDLLAVQ